MNLIRWQVPQFAVTPSFGRLSTLRDEIDRLFGSPLTELARTAQLFGESTPALDVREDKDNFVVAVELPGMKREDINVTLEDGNLIISGERKREKKFENAEVRRSERSFGYFQRSLALPALVAADKISGVYKNGVLTVTLPKAEEAKPKQINVQVN